jgi:hypothetical protein
VDGIVAKASRVTVLVEDARTQRLVVRYLIRCGYGTHEISAEPLPAGRGGSGEKWVRDRYGIQVAACRRRCAKARTALIVAVDADTESVSTRLQQFGRALHDAGIPPRASDEAIALLIPKRNVETWILCLAGDTVDEVTDYKSDPKIAGLIPAAAVTLFEWSRSTAAAPDHCVPSLRLAVAELARLE